MKKISVSLSGHQTSISLEPEFVLVLKEIAKLKKVSMAQLIADIDSQRQLGINLSSAIRVWVLQYLKNK